jgi:thiamine biosynthesis protein ThiS
VTGHLGLDAARVAIEHNGTIVPQDCFAATALNDGDRLEVVQFVGGG